MALKPGSDKPGPKKPHAGQFQKGVSGNPGGKPKMSPEDREFYQDEFHKLTRKTVSRFHQILDDDNESHELWLRVGSEVFTRYFGKMMKGFSGEGDDSGGVSIQALPDGIFKIELVDSCNSPEK